jgi:hypothetical protein
MLKQKKEKYNMWFDREQMKKDMDEFLARLHETEKEQQRIIDEDCNGDEDAYLKATFNLSSASLLLELTMDDVRSILYKKLPDDSPRRQVIIDGLNGNDIKTRLIYPGGYNAFVEDVKNGYYSEYSDFQI